MPQPGHLEALTEQLRVAACPSPALLSPGFAYSIRAGGEAVSATWHLLKPLQLGSPGDVCLPRQPRGVAGDKLVGRAQQEQQGRGQLNLGVVSLRQESRPSNLSCCLCFYSSMS